MAKGLRRNAPSRRAVLLALAGVAASAFLIREAVAMIIGLHFSGDAEAYWRSNLDRLYENAEFNGPNAFLYSPVFAQVISPLTELTFRGFYAIWTAMQNVALVVVLGPVAAATSHYVVPGVRENLFSGNVHILMGLAIVAGFRYPAAWAFMLLTKVTPGVGLLWFAVRGEWRALGIAFGATAALVAISFALAPEAWFDWFELLRREGDPAVAYGTVLRWPLWVRLVAAAAVVIAAALTSQRWLVPFSVLLAQPAVWRSAPAVLVAVVPLFVADRFPAVVSRVRARTSWLAILLAPWILFVPIAAGPRAEPPERGSLHVA